MKIFKVKRLVKDFNFKDIIWKHKYFQLNNIFNITPPTNRKLIIRLERLLSKGPTFFWYVYIVQIFEYWLALKPTFTADI